MLLCILSFDALIKIQLQEAEHLISSPVVYSNFHANKGKISGIPIKVRGGGGGGVVAVLYKC